jgi:hypothetical protein
MTAAAVPTQRRKGGWQTPEFGMGSMSRIDAPKPTPARRKEPPPIPASLAEPAPLMLLCSVCDTSRLARADRTVLWHPATSGGETFECPGVGLPGQEPTDE